jgi:hypothetical protein
MPRIRDLGINVIPGGLWADQGCQGSGCQGASCQPSAPNCADTCGDSCRASCADTPQEKGYRVGGLDVAAISQLRQQLQSYVNTSF